MRSILLICLMILQTSAIRAQDKVYTLQGDSIPVNIPADPWGELRINYSNLGHSLDYGFQRIAILYKKDSIRIHTPFQIRGFYREAPGKHLGNGYFESTVIYEQQLFLHARQRRTLEKTPRRVFRQLLFRGEDLSIWHYREHASYNLPSSYFFFETPGDTAVFVKYSEFKNWASGRPKFNDLSNQLPKPAKRTGGLFGYFERLATQYQNGKQE